MPVTCSHAQMANVLPLHLVELGLPRSICPIVYVLSLLGLRADISQSLSHCIIGAQAADALMAIDPRH